MIKIGVLLKRESVKHSIVVGINNLKYIGDYISKLSIGNSAFIISNPNIYRLYGDFVKSSLIRAGIKDVGKYLVTEGEKYKTSKEYIKILGVLAKFDNTLTKDVFIINLGGGVIGDLGGFVAATYRRGIPYVQVPTSLLAFVDSGVGGKVGIDLLVGNNIIKNKVGSFHQPVLVFGDVSVLKTLPTRELIAGISEIIKYGIIADKKLFEFIEKNYKKILNLDMNSLLYIIEKSYKIKADIVEKDEFDKKDIRVKLNFGHTLGHAIESASKLNLKHGEAISIGIICAFKIANELSMINKGHTKRIERLLGLIGLPIKIRGCNYKDIFDALSHDKKFKHRKNKFVLPVEIGKIKVVSDVPKKIIEKIIGLMLK